jgi:hypothetical protein
MVPIEGKVDTAYSDEEDRERSLVGEASGLLQLDQRQMWGEFNGNKVSSRRRWPAEKVPCHGAEVLKRVELLGATRRTVGRWCENATAETHVA